MIGRQDSFRHPEIPIICLGNILCRGPDGVLNDGRQQVAGPRNVLGGDLELCSDDPMTGFFRDGKCRTGHDDRGVHAVCTRVTREFLEFSLNRGNDLVHPLPQYGFPGLTPGDRWCLCAARWKEALREGVAPPVILAATHISALEFVGLDDLVACAEDAPRQPGNSQPPPP